MLICHSCWTPVVVSHEYIFVSFENHEWFVHGMFVEVDFFCCHFLFWSLMLSYFDILPLRRSGFAVVLSIFNILSKNKWTPITLCKVRAADLLNKSIASWEVGEFLTWSLEAVVRNHCIKNTIFWKLAFQMSYGVCTWQVFKFSKIGQLRIVINTKEIVPSSVVDTVNCDMSAVSVIFMRSVGLCFCSERRCCISRFLPQSVMTF